MSDIKIVIGADVAELQRKLTQAGGVTQDFANKTAAANKKVSESFTTLSATVSKLPAPFANTVIGIKAFETSLKKIPQAVENVGIKSKITSAALSSLGNIAGGVIGVGIGLATAAVIAFAENLLGLNKKVEDNREQLELSISTYDKFLTEIEKTSAAAAQEGAKVSILFDAISDSNTGLKHRATLIGQLNDISPGYLGSLDKEKATYEQIAKAITEYTDSLAISAEIKALMPQVEGFFQKLIKAQIELNQLRRFKTDEQNILGLPMAEFKKQEQEILNRIKNFKNQIQIAKRGLSFIAGGDLSLSEILFGKNDAKEKVVKVKVKKIEVDIKDAVVAQAGKIDLPAVIDGIADAEFSQGSQSNEKIAGAVADRMIGGGVDDVDKQLKEKLDKLYDSFEGMLQSGTIDLVTSAAEAIGSAAGGASIPNLFEGLMGNVGQQIQDLGKFLIKSGIQIKIAKEAFQKLLANPIASIAVGIGLVALGALLKSQAKKQYGFASGTSALGGGVFADVGERGKERVFLPGGAKVQPNNELNAFGGQGITLQPSILYQADGFRIMLNRTDRRWDRNN